MDGYSGATFNRGLYRLHTQGSGTKADIAIRETYPEFLGWIHSFGFDWLGRQFAVLDRRRDDAGRLLVMMFEPGTGYALEIPATFAVFHNRELLEQTDAALASEWFADWAGANPDELPLSHDTCAGYRVPLFLGGKDDSSNLEVSDIDVYWSIVGQLRLTTGASSPQDNASLPSEASDQPSLFENEPAGD